MKNLYATIVVISLVAATAHSFSPEELNRVSVNNDTGYDFLYLFISPGDSAHWGLDVLGATRTLDHGETVDFLVHYPESCGEFDFLAIDEDHDSYRFGVEVYEDSHCHFLIEYSHMVF